MPVATPYNGAHHITSDNDISVYACNYIRGTQDIAIILPTEALDTFYIVQDYPAWDYGAQVAFVATEDNTVLTMTVPCNIQGTTITGGTTLTPVLQRGQAYLLISQGNLSSFSGMQVTSNGKPFALFQGGRRVKVPSNGSGSDLLYGQALPTCFWGTDYIVPGASYQSGENRVRITAAENGTLLNITGSTGPISLNAGETHEHVLPTSDACRITSNKPVNVTLYLTSYVTANYHGDPSSVTMPALDRGICKAVFKLDMTNDITANQLYLNIVSPTVSDSSLRLDGSPLPTNDIMSTLGDYTIHRLTLPWTNSNQGIHQLENTEGTFIAYGYGLGYYESFAFPLGYQLSASDTTEYFDTVCQHHAYQGYGFDIDTAQTAESGELDFWSSTADADTIRYTHLILTVLPASSSDTTIDFSAGDTVFFSNDTLTEAGTYTITLTAANGCDSVVTLHLIHTIIHDTVDYFDTVCEGSGAYLRYGFYVDATETARHNTLERWRLEDLGDTIRHHHLTLVVLPLASSDTSASIILGDTLYFQNDTLTVAGDYVYTFTAANGCDSTVTLHLAYEEVGLTASAEGVCPGDPVTVVAHGTHDAHWIASPPDPGLDSQQGHTTITVYPDTTTTYHLLDASGQTIASISVGVEPPPTLCVETSRPFIDFDFPVVLFTDCSEGSATSTWSFSDGITLSGHTVRHHFHYPLPDSIGVTLSSCNRYNCCADTSFSLPALTRSVWFPNVFMPGEETNNRFGVTASFEIVDYELHIYNRMGLLVFHTTDPSDLWDGTCNGAPVPQGTYAYHWHVRDSIDYNRTGVGTVTLIR
ncbi:MAG: gliding motility-associated C-terminal domain-containing protein [Bacteroidales bacterium]|nr:gliding motility-associated C-terminal domain-containing protein [Bacteroidales bacterium]